MRLDLPGNFVFGKKNIMRVFFRSQQDKKPLFRKFNDVLESMKTATSQYCLFFTNKTTAEIQKVLASYNETVFA